MREFVALPLPSTLRHAARPSVGCIGEFGEFVADRVVLYRSEPEQGGARSPDEASSLLAAAVAA